MSYSNTTGYPSSTQILSPFVDNRWFTDECRERGTAVHAAIESHLNGVWVLPLVPQWQGYFDSFKRWADSMIDEIILTEKRFIDPIFGFCGKPDAVLRLKDDEVLSLADWKTSATISPTWSAQIASYRHLARKDAGIKTKRGFSLRLKTDGSMPILDEYSNYNRDWNAFLGALTAWKHFKEVYK